MDLKKFQEWKANEGVKSETNRTRFGNYRVGKPHHEYVGFWWLARSVILTRQKKLAVPVYLLWGTEDGIAPLNDFKIASGLENYNEKTYSGGHYWFLAHKEEMLSDLREVLALDN